MAVKHFLVNHKVSFSDKEIIRQKREREERGALDNDNYRRLKNVLALHSDEELKCIEGRVIIKIDLTNKNFHTFSDGTLIRLERQFNNFNRRETEPVNCIVIDSTYIPSGSEILIHPNEVHDANRIFNYKDKSPDVKYYSIKEECCFAYFDGEWKPLKGFDFALRVYKPHSGIIQGIEPTKLKDCLYVITGELRGKVVMTLEACDYQIVFQDKNGREGNLIRFRPFGNEKEKREPEAIAIYDNFTEQVESGELIVGLSASKAQPLNAIHPT